MKTFLFILTAVFFVSLYANVSNDDYENEVMVEVSSTGFGV